MPRKKTTRKPATEPTDSQAEKPETKTQTTETAVEQKAEATEPEPKPKPEPPTKAADGKGDEGLTKDDGGGDPPTGDTTTPDGADCEETLAELQNLLDEATTEIDRLRAEIDRLHAEAGTVAFTETAAERLLTKAARYFTSPAGKTVRQLVGTSTGQLFLPTAVGPIREHLRELPRTLLFLITRDSEELTETTLAQLIAATQSN